MLASRVRARDAIAQPSLPRRERNVSRARHYLSAASTVMYRPHHSAIKCHKPNRRRICQSLLAEPQPFAQLDERNIAPLSAARHHA
jgi:hypothetical protein